MISSVARRISFIALSAALLLGPWASVATAAPTDTFADSAAVVGNRSPQLPKVPLMTGDGGAVASVDADASQIGIDVLRAGGNAADAAIATAAALGVTEPYSAGIGGGGFLVYYDARKRIVRTIDGREAAPASFTDRTFTDTAGAPLNFTAVVNSGLSVGVPGTPALWDKAARQFGTRKLWTCSGRQSSWLNAGSWSTRRTPSRRRDNKARFRTLPGDGPHIPAGRQRPCGRQHLPQPGSGSGVPHLAAGRSARPCTTANWGRRSWLPPGSRRQRRG